MKEFYRFGFVAVLFAVACVQGCNKPASNTMDRPLEDVEAELAPAEDGS